MAAKTWPAEAVISNKRKNAVYRYRSERWPGRMLEFQYQDGNDTKYYNCIDCRKLKTTNKDAGPTPRIAIQFDRFLSDPDYPKNDHFCNPDNNRKSTIGAALGRREMYAARDNIRANKRKPKTEFEETLKKVRIDPKYCNESPEVQQQMESFIGGENRGFESKRRALSINRNKDIIRNVTVDNIPMQFQTTLRGRQSSNENNRFANEVFLQLQVSTENLKLLVNINSITFLTLFFPGILR